jgi:LDH2 family malate/lactate/ureidoglycolate dehydrogenase
MERSNMEQQSEVVSIPARATQALIADALAAAGLPQPDAASCAELMSEADLAGADGHGIFRLPQYVRRLAAGGFNKRPNITVSRTAPATALVDGDNGMGHLVMSRAASEAIDGAWTGAAWVGVGRSNHAGPAGLYAEMPPAAGMIGLYAGRADLLLGTNPLAIAVPTGAEPLVFDMATSIVAYGTVKKYALRSLRMPEGWFVDAATGASITDPAKSAAGVLQLMGGVRPRRDRFQRRRRQRHQYRTLHRCRRHRTLYAAKEFYCRSRSAYARFARLAAFSRFRCDPTAERAPRRLPR